MLSEVKVESDGDNTVGKEVVQTDVNDVFLTVGHDEGVSRSFFVGMTIEQVVDVVVHRDCVDKMWTMYEGAMVSNVVRARDVGDRRTFGDPYVERQGETAKVRCDICGYDVNPVGHERRCGVSMQRRPRGWSVERARAWYGDALMRQDVQTILVAIGVEPHELGGALCKIMSKDFHSECWDRGLKKCGVMSPSGTSTHTVSTVVEANYRGDFRREFLQMIPWSEFVIHD
jgi:hypothetical protein